MMSLKGLALDLPYVLLVQIVTLWWNSVMRASSCSCQRCVAASEIEQRTSHCFHPAASEITVHQQHNLSMEQQENITEDHL